MQFNLESSRQYYGIRAYGPGTVTVSIPLNAEEPAPHALDAIGPDATRMRQETLSHSSIISPTRLVRDWTPRRFNELCPAHFEAVLELTPEIVLLGTGGELRWPETRIMAPIINAGIGFEVMSTAAACRTYNILMGDGRNVAAALLLI